MSAVLDSAGLAGAFAAIVAKEDVKIPKPHAQPYRLALRRLQVAAAHAVALEDSPIGLASARSAGLVALAVGHRLESGPWHGDYVYLPSLEDIDRAMAAIRASRMAGG